MISERLGMYGRKGHEGNRHGVAADGPLTIILQLTRIGYFDLTRLQKDAPYDRACIQCSVFFAAAAYDNFVSFHICISDDP